MANGFTFQGKGVLSRIDRAATKAGKTIVTLVIEVGGKYPQLVPIKVFGQLAERSTEWTPGTVLEVTGRLGGRDWNGRVYGDSVAESVVAVGDVAEPSKEEPNGDDTCPF